MTIIFQRNMLTQEPFPKIVVCPKYRCDQCPFSNNEGECEILITSQTRRERVILVEPTRGFLHIQQGNSEKVPPWYNSNTQIWTENHDRENFVGNRWESIYINRESRDILETLFFAYPVGPYLSLFSREKDDAIFYKSVPRIKTPLEYEIIDKLGRKVVSPNIDKITSLAELLRNWREEILTKINVELPEVKMQTRIRIASIVAHSRSALGSIFPLLMDELVEDIFLDRPGSAVYFDHRVLGRCSSSIIIQQNSATRLATLLRAESNFHLDRENPSLKAEMFIENGLFRFSVTVPPLSYDGIHLEIRRARTNPFTLYELIKNGTITREAAALLLLAISARMNITIAGEPGTGKTTLLNALDFCTPRNWRKIYVEDTIESRIQHGHHQIRYRVNPVDEIHGRLSKIDEVTKALHRSPDYLILGEIQEAEHSRALFQALMAGLRSIQTCHSSSAAALISRWRFAHKIKEHAIALMDLIIILERPQPGKSRRHVKEIVEIRRGVDNGTLKLHGFNTLYSSAQSIYMGQWAKDGAVLDRSREYGVGDPSQCVQGILSKIDQDLSTSIETHWKIGELLWRNGNPFTLEVTSLFGETRLQKKRRL